MKVAQLLHKLRVISDVEVVVPLLPEMIRIANQAPRYSLLQGLQRIGQRVRLQSGDQVRVPTQAKTGLEWGTLVLWFAEQEMNVLRHDYVPVNLKLEAAPHPLQGGFEDSSAGVRGKQATAVVTAECDEVTLAAVVKARQSPGHEDNLVLFADSVCDV